MPPNTEGLRENHTETSAEQHVPCQLSTKCTRQVGGEGQGAQPPRPYLLLLRPAATR